MGRPTGGRVEGAATPIVYACPARSSVDLRTRSNRWPTNYRWRRRNDAPRPVSRSPCRHSLAGRSAMRRPSAWKKRVRRDSRSLAAGAINLVRRTDSACGPRRNTSRLSRRCVATANSWRLTTGRGPIAQAFSSCRNPPGGCALFCERSPRTPIVRHVPLVRSDLAPCVVQPRAPTPIAGGTARQQFPANCDVASTTRALKAPAGSAKMALEIARAIRSRRMRTPSHSSRNLPLKLSTP
jgi:hypothetical protein